MLLARRKFVVSSLLFTASTLLFSESISSGLAQTIIRDGQTSDEVLRDPVYRFTKETLSLMLAGTLRRRALVAGW